MTALEPLRSSGSQVSLGLAPMEGVTDLPYRMWMRWIGGMDYMVTSFMRITPTFPPESIPFYCPDQGLDNAKVIPQMMASSPSRFVDVAKRFTETAECIEINCGCPAPKVVGNGAGSSLLRDPRSFEEFMKHICNALGPEKVAVKIRLGFHKQSEFFTLLDKLERMPIRKLTIHGRTRDQGYSGQANWGAIWKAAQWMPFPVIGSGDIADTKTFRERVGSACPSENNKLSQVPGVIIGRGAIRNPWIFKMLKSGGKHSFDAQALLKSFQTFYLLHVGFFSEDLKLLDLVTSDDSGDAFDKEFWDKRYDETLQCLNASDNKITHCRRALGRTKLLWNYFRSSLPIELIRSGKVLRASNFVDFLAEMSKVFEESKNDEDKISIRYNPQHNWVYAGKSKS